MSTSPETIDRILSHAGDSLELGARKMFGEYGIYLDGKMVAMVCDDTLFVKPLPVALELLGECEHRSPYPGAKSHPVVSDEFMVRDGELAELLRRIWKAMPAPKPKAPRVPKGRAARRA